MPELAKIDSLRTQPSEAYYYSTKYLAQLLCHQVCILKHVSRASFQSNMLQISCDKRNVCG